MRQKDKFKQSEIGLIPEDWDIAKVGDVSTINHATINKNHSFKKIEYMDIDSVNNGCIEKTRLLNFNEAPSRARRIVKDRDIIISTVRPNLKHFAFIKRPRPNTVVSTGFAVITSIKINAQFLYYCLTTDEFTNFLAAIADAHTSTYPSFNPDIIENAYVPFPSVMEQRAIAHILGTLDDKIELDRRLNETLEAIARAVFKSWFIDFDPVIDNAIRAGNPIPSVLAEKAARRRELLSRLGAEGQDPGLPKHIADFFPAGFEDLEIGPIPAGWRVVSLPEVIDINPPRALRKGDIAPYLDMANMPTRGQTPDAVIERTFGSGMRFINGDTLVARITPCLENGKTAYVDFLADGQVGWGSTEYIVLCPKPPLPSEFGYCLARSTEFREFAIQSMTGTSGRQRVPAEALSYYVFAAPPEGIAKLFGKFVRPFFLLTRSAANESRTLAALRGTLLPKLISGQRRVKDAERFLENIV